MSKKLPSIEIDFITRTSCNLCDQIYYELQLALDNYPMVTLKTYDADKTGSLPENRQAFIVPAIWVSNKLWFMGGFDSYRFQQKLDSLTCS